VRLLPGQQVLEIQYTGISFTNPEQVRFQYKLEGLEDEWTPVGTRRTAYYSHLPPGEYTFRVLAANRDGTWNAQGASLRIVVVPPFWRTWWFLGLGVLVIAATVGLIYHRRVSRLQKAHAAQEAFSRQLIASQERERGRIAAELHDGLGQNLLIIKNRAFMAGNKIADPPAALAQIAEISATAALAVDEVREIARNLRPYQLDRLGLTLALKDIVHKTSETSAIDVTGDIDELAGLLPPEAEINLYRIVQEGVNNVVKHSGATTAQIEVKRDGGRLLVRIADNGRGFSIDAADGPLPEGGFGLAGIRERARILGGTCTIQSAQGGGTVIQVTVNLPMPAEG
jgi:signal transduction histidine kinase